MDDRDAVGEGIEQLPADVQEDLAARGKHDLFFFAQGVLGYGDMTEACHLPLCMFLEENPKRFKLILMPRDHFKTSLVTIAGTMQKLVRNPEERILIGNESATNASRFLRSIRQHAESNRVFRALYSSVIPQDTRSVRWNDAELDFRREGKYPEPTIDTIGMTGAFTSRHYTHITIDDPISEDALSSERIMQDVISRMKAMQALLVKPMSDSIWLVGTRWAHWDVYAWYEQSFGTLLGRFVRAAIEDGVPIFPELMDMETLALKRRTMGDYKFSCLYMNNPRNSDTQDLNVDLLNYFGFTRDGDAVALHSKVDGSVQREWRLDQLEITVAVDLAGAETMDSDRNAVTTVGVSPLGEMIVLDVFAERCTPLRVIEKLFELKARFNPRMFGIEDVAYQKAFKYFVREEANRRGLYLRHEPIKANGKKEVRIQGLQPLMGMGKVYVHASQQLLLQEMSEFPLGKHDDTVDSLSMHLQMMRGRLSPAHLEKVEREVQRMTQLIKRNGGSFKMERIADDPAARRAWAEDMEYEEMTTRDRERVGGFDEHFISSV